ncbi:hypothetical protein [Streptomyces brasiliensis]|uniref:hypothetical protein n=1 Tax=Streptomyces brasiliensis TaxID=1954 RepID=UPI0016717AF7|nr:hypothetical protein [Streptomyces brasiliensis]
MAQVVRDHRPRQHLAQRRYRPRIAAPGQGLERTTQRRRPALPPVHPQSGPRGQQRVEGVGGGRGRLEQLRARGD